MTDFDQLPVSDLRIICHIETIGKYTIRELKKKVDLKSYFDSGVCFFSRRFMQGNKQIQIVLSPVLNQDRNYG